MTTKKTVRNRAGTRPANRRNVPSTMRDFSLSLPMALLKARESVMQRFRPILRTHGVTEQQWRVLRALMETDGVEVSELARICFLLMPSLSRILRDLESRKLIKRAVVKDDTRRATISISAAGRRLVNNVGPSSEAMYAQITTAVGAKTIDQLYALLDHVSQTLEEDASTCDDVTSAKRAGGNQY